MIGRTYYSISLVARYLLTSQRDGGKRPSLILDPLACASGREFIDSSTAKNPSHETRRFILWRTQEPDVRPFAE